MTFSNSVERIREGEGEKERKKERGSLRSYRMKRFNQNPGIRMFSIYQNENSKLKFFILIIFLHLQENRKCIGHTLQFVSKKDIEYLL